MQQPRLFNQDGKRLDSARKQRIQTEYCSVLHPANAMSKSDLPTYSKESEHFGVDKLTPQSPVDEYRLMTLAYIGKGQRARRPRTEEASSLCRAPEDAEGISFRLGTLVLGRSKLFLGRLQLGTTKFREGSRD